MTRLAGLLFIVGLLCGCSLFPKTKPDAPTGSDAGQAKPSERKSTKPVLKKGGGYYQDDGPSDEIPDNIDDIPDAQPKWETLSKAAMRPYVVLGRQYIPHTSVKPYKERGIASWYGKKFQGKKTSTGETYDMFAMSAAHTTLALPSYVRVTNVRNGKAVVVRVNDRGPFHVGRIIDLSYTAAHKLDIIGNGSSEVEIEAVIPSGSVVLAEAPVARPVVATAPVQTPPAAEQRDEIAELMKRLEREEKQVAPAKGIFLQLGAFANADNAENLKNHLASELEWLAEPLLIQVSGGIHRLQAGPYASREDALRVAERIRQALGTKPNVVTR